MGLRQKKPFGLIKGPTYVIGPSFIVELQGYEGSG